MGKILDSTWSDLKKVGFGSDRVSIATRSDDEVQTRSGCDRVGLNPTWPEYPIGSSKKKKLTHTTHYTLRFSYFTVYTYWHIIDYTIHTHNTLYTKRQRATLTAHKYSQQFTHFETHKQHIEQDQSAVSAAETKGLKSDSEPSSICWKRHPTGHLLPRSVSWSAAIYCRDLLPSPICCRDLCRDLLPSVAAICVVSCCHLLPRSVPWSTTMSCCHLLPWPKPPTQPDSSFLPWWLCDPNPFSKIWSFIISNSIFHGIYYIVIYA